MIMKGENGRIGLPTRVHTTWSLDTGMIPGIDPYWQRWYDFGKRKGIHEGFMLFFLTDARQS